MRDVDTYALVRTLTQEEARVRDGETLRMTVAHGGMLAAMGLAAALCAGSPAAAAGPGDWPTYGHDRGGMRFSPLTQINAATVGQLKPAWAYTMKPATA